MSATCWNNAAVTGLCAMTFSGSFFSGPRFIGADGVMPVACRTVISSSSRSIGLAR